MKRAGTSILIGPNKISSTVKIMNGAVIGKPFRRLLGGYREPKKTTVLKRNAYIGYYSIIGAGSEIGTGSIIDDFTVIESRVTVGNGCLFIYRAQVCNDVRIGDNCVIGGLIGERTAIGNGCRIFGKIVHSQRNPKLQWDDDGSEEPSPKICDFVFVAFGATVSGSITIKDNAYVLPGAVVTSDVPAFNIAYGINKFTHFSKWSGDLRKSPFFLKK
jgi:acetyltransferase-like isoleucine patch superfamily enzyme